MKKIRKFHQFQTSKIDFESAILALFDELSFIDRIKKKYFDYVDFWQKPLKFLNRTDFKLNRYVSVGKSYGEFLFCRYWILREKHNKLLSLNFSLKKEQNIKIIGIKPIKIMHFLCAKCSKLLRISRTKET